MRKKKYIANGIVESFIVPILEKEIRNWINSLPTNDSELSLLDVGCGNQPFRDLIESRGIYYYGLDISDHDNSPDFICPIDQPLPLDVSSLGPFDFILCTEVLEHVENWHIVFENLSKISRKGTLTFISCPHFYPLHEEPYDFWRPTIHVLKKFATQYAYDVQEIKKAGGFWEVLGTLLSSVNYIEEKDERNYFQKFGAIFFRLSFRMLLFLLKKNIAQDKYVAYSPVYLSNIMTLIRK